MKNHKLFSINIEMSSTSKSWSVSKLLGKLEEHSSNPWWYKWGNWVQGCEAGQLVIKNVWRSDVVPEAREPFLLGWDLWTCQSEFHLKENTRELNLQASWGLFQGPWQANVRLRFELKAFDIELNAHKVFKRLLGKLSCKLHRHFPRHTEYPPLALYFKNSDKQHEVEMLLLTAFSHTWKFYFLFYFFGLRSKVHLFKAWDSTQSRNWIILLRVSCTLAVQTNTKSPPSVTSPQSFTFPFCLHLKTQIPCIHLR